MNDDNCLFSFQIGRSSEEPIDFVVADTVPGIKSIPYRTSSCVGGGGGSNSSSVGQSRVAQSTISRFACRLLIERNSLPARAYVFAAGFDSSRNIFLGVKHTSSTGSEAFLLLCFSSFLFRKRREREGDREEGGGDF